MDDPIIELENELKALRPRRPSADLQARLARELDSARPAVGPAYASATTFRSWKWVGWQLAAAAALILLGVAAGWRVLAPSATRPSVPPVPAALAARDTYEPVGATNMLYDVQDEGPVATGDTSAVRRVRARYVDTYTWRNPATNASLKWSVPRDEVRVIPASFH